MPKARSKKGSKATDSSAGAVLNAPASARTVLLAVTGLSPAIVTETVWALAHEDPPKCPGHVLLMTTKTGATKIQEQLLTPFPALGGVTAWEALRTALNAQADELILETVVLSAPNSNTGTMCHLDDIATPEQNRAAATFILEKVRGLVENPDIHVVASIAGGRKTMGALLHAAMTLLARETDRITHVLVSPPFETLPGFFFPDQPGESLRDRAGQCHAPSSAAVSLADVPFVPLRNRFKELNQVPGTFDGVIRSFSKLLQEDAPVLVSLDYEGKKLVVDGVLVPCPRSVLLVVQFLFAARERKIPLQCQEEVGEALAQWWKDGHPKQVNRGIFSVSERDLNGEFVRKKLSDLRTALRKAGVRWQVAVREWTLKGAELARAGKVQVGR